MRGIQTRQSSMLCLLSPEERVPQRHPLRRIKKLADDALEELSPLFDQMYSTTGRPSVPPERLLKAMVLMALYGVRSERLLCEQLDYNLLFRWFLDMDMVEEAFDATAFSHNRQRLMDHEVAARFFSSVVGNAQRAGLMSSEHFSVDGTLIEAWGDFRGTKRSNETHQSKTDPEARLARKGNGREAKLCFSAHALMENRSGLLVDFQLAEASPKAEPRVALEMLGRSVGGTHRATVGADRGYDQRGFVAGARQLNTRTTETGQTLNTIEYEDIGIILNVTPHVAQFGQRGGNRGSAIDGRTVRHRGYGQSLVKRMRVEEIFGWMKSSARFARSRWRGIARTQLMGHMVAAAYNLLRMGKLLPEGA